MPIRNTDLNFLLGAGFSLAAGMPSTWTLTNEVLRGGHYKDCINRPPDERVRFQQGYSLESVLQFVALLKRELTSYYSHDANRWVNYEDIMSTAQQIFESYSHWGRGIENPTISAFVRSLIPEISNELIDIRRDNLPHHIPNHARVKMLALDTLLYIRHVVSHFLTQSHQDLDYFAPLSDAMSIPGVGKVDIFTLNHDVLVETFLEARNIPYEDGFGGCNPELPEKPWTPSKYNEANDKLRLFKLHGSTDWFNINTADQRALSPFTNTEVFKLLRGGGGRPPLFLAGTFNKVLEYTLGIYADIHSAFRDRISDSGLLLIIGYGFGDSGINAQLFNSWLKSYGAQKTLIVDPNPNLLRERVQDDFMRSIINMQQEKGRVTCLAKKADELTIADIQQWIAAPSE